VHPAQLPCRLVDSQCRSTQILLPHRQICLPSCQQSSKKRDNLASSSSFPARPETYTHRANEHVIPPSSTNRQFNLRCCPALLDKAKAKNEALASVNVESPEAKRRKRADDDVSKQNAAEPFMPPYVPELFLGCMEGLEGESNMSILVGST